MTGTQYTSKAMQTTLVNIQSWDLNVVDGYKYLGVHLNNKLD